MDAGRVVPDGPPAEVFRNVEKLREVGLDVPAASLAHRLRDRGIGGRRYPEHVRPARRSLCRRRSFTLKLMQPDVATPILELRGFAHIPGRYSEGERGGKGRILQVHRGERVGIVGATESGKSTVVDSFAHLLPRAGTGLLQRRGRGRSRLRQGRTAA